MESETLSAREAADELGISLPTLYAYVSRGLIRSEAIGDKRSKRYRREDVQALKQRKELREDPSKATEGALHWGLPLLDSQITLIADGRLYYRGYEVTRLASERSVEEVAALIWTGDAGTRLSGSFTPSARLLALWPMLADLLPLDRLQVLVPLAAADDASAYDLRSVSAAQTGARMLRLLTAGATGDFSGTASAAETLQRRWAPHAPEAATALNTALILAADHELNVSAFTTRCVASAGSSPYGAVQAGLAAIQGSKHGGHCDRVEALFQEAGTPERARACLTSRLRRGEEIPGFGHPLYPQGDPRGRALIELATRSAPDAPALALAHALMQSAEELIAEQPTIDFGLVLLARAFGLPPGAAIALFAIGRSIGWIGHALEQYQEDRIIRPRARYVGPAPIASSEA